jgi:hypothetical protein
MAIQEALPTGLIVYLLHDAWGHVKVGRTNNLKARLATLQTGNAARLTVAAWFRCSSDAEAAGIEGATKCLLRNHKTGGGDEWFHVDFDDALKALECACDGR